MARRNFSLIDDTTHVHAFKRAINYCHPHNSMLKTKGLKAGQDQVAQSHPREAKHFNVDDAVLSCAWYPNRAPLGLDFLTRRFSKSIAPRHYYCLSGRARRVGVDTKSLHNSQESEWGC